MISESDSSVKVPYFYCFPSGILRRSGPRSRDARRAMFPSARQKFAVSQKEGKRRKARKTGQHGLTFGSNSSFALPCSPLNGNNWLLGLQTKASRVLSGHKTYFSQGKKPILQLLLNCYCEWCMALSEHR